MNYGVMLIPEGVVQFIPSVQNLIAAINAILSPDKIHGQKLGLMTEASERIAYISGLLSPTARQNFGTLPIDIQTELLNERDAHGNINMSAVPIEQLFKALISKEMAARKRAGKYHAKFKVNTHFFGYEGRSGFPSNFDANYCYSLGRTTSKLLEQRYNGYMARVYNLEKPPTEWLAGGVPVTMLLNMELRHGRMKPVIRKALVDPDTSAAFSYFSKRRHKWAQEDHYRFPGGIQFAGPPALTDSAPMSTVLKKVGQICVDVDFKDFKTEKSEEAVTTPYISYDDSEETMADVNPLVSYYGVPTEDAKNIRFVLKKNPRGTFDLTVCVAKAGITKGRAMPKSG